MHTVWFHLYKVQKQAKIIYSDNNPNSGRFLERQWIGTENEETFWGNGYVLYLSWAGSYMGIYICQNLANHTLKIHTFYRM